MQEIEREIIAILKAGNISIVDKEFTNRKLPGEVMEDPDIEGDLYFHGLFQRSN